MATSSSSSSVASSSLRCTFLISFSLSLSLPIFSRARCPFSFSLCLLHLFAPCPLVSCPYRRILEHSMVHPVLHIMYPTTVLRPLPPLPHPLPPFGWTRPLHPPVSATLMIHERIINAPTSIEVFTGLPKEHDRLPLEDDLFEWQR